MIEVKHIWFSYEQWGEFVLKDISFSVEKGEIVGVLGANGVGKTTLLKVLAGLLPPRPREKEPERGVWLDGKPIRECNAEIAFISEAGTYLKDLTPREYGAFLADFYPSFDMAYYEKLLHFFGLEEKPIKKMSKGMKQKIGIVCAFMNDPDVIILDEPTSGLDVINALEIRKMIKELSKTENMSFLLSSHNMLEIEFVSDRVGIIAGGRLLAVGKINELKEKYNSANLEEVFEKVVKQNEIS